MGWFNNIKTRNRLFIVFGILLSITIFFAVFAVMGMNNVGDNFSELINAYQARQTHIAETVADVYRIQLVNMSKGYLLEEELKEIVSEIHINHEENISLFNENLSAFRALVFSDKRLSESERQARLDLVNGIKILFDSYVEMTRQLDVAADKNDHPAMINVIKESIPVGSELSNKVQELRDLVSTTTMRKTSQTLDVMSRTTVIIAGVAAAFISLSVLILLFTVRSFSQPISELEKAVVEIGKGNFSYPIRSERKDELGSLANCIDDMIEEIVKNKDMATVAEMASAAKSLFLTNMSHEIRTPMNAILGITEIQLRDETLKPHMREALNKIDSAGDLLLSIINDILDLSKIEAGKLDLSPNKYETASLINDTVSLNMMRIGNKPIEFVLSVDDNTPSTLIGDELRIKQILNNLLTNAFKYTEKGVVKLSVSAQTESKDEKSGVTLVFVVSDTGQGMTDEQIDKLFDEYTRFNTEANHMIEGTGLGMSITQKLINMMNGSISVKSEVHWGSVFTVRLPQGRTDANVLGKNLAESLQNFQLNDAKQMRKALIVYEPMFYGSVLIVDDVESNLYVAKGLLAPYGLAIDTAVNGFEAIEKIKSGNVYDIVFMDHMMPKMDGIETTKIMRSLGYTHPVVALTANAGVGQADVFLANGFNSFISKPIDMRQMNALLKKYVRDKQPYEIIEAARQQKVEQKEQRAEATTQPLDTWLLEFFMQDASRSVAALEDIHKKSGAYDDEDIQMLTNTAHVMKSALTNIGEPELSSFAAKLEQAGRNKDTDKISSQTPAFLSELRVIIEKFALDKTDENGKPANEDYIYLREKLLAVKEACGTYDKRTAKAVIAELRQNAWPRSIKELLCEMADQLLVGDFDEVSNAAEKIIKMV